MCWRGANLNKHNVLALYLAAALSLYSHWAIAQVTGAPPAGPSAGAPVAVPAGGGPPLSPKVADAKPGDLRLIVTGAFIGVFTSISAQAEQAANHPLLVEYGAARGGLRQEILDGQDFEVAILLPDVNREIVAQQKALPKGYEIAHLPVGIGIRGNVESVDISTPAALRSAMLNAAAVRYQVNGAGQPTFDKIVSTLGIADQIKDANRLKLPRNMPVGPGEYELNVYPISEILSNKALRNLGPVLANLQVPLVVEAVIGKHANDPRAAKAVVDFLRGPAVDAALRANGMEKSTLITALSDEAARPAHKETYYLYVLNDPAQGREDEYNDWYDHQHAPDVVSIPGFVSAQRYIWSEQQLRPDAHPPTKYMIEFKIVTDDLPAVYAEVIRRIREHITVMSTSLAPGTGGGYTFRAITGVMRGKGGDVRTSKKGQSMHYIQMVFGSATPGEEIQFNDWYDHVHAPSVASTPGFQQWQRFELSPVQLGEAHSDRYMVKFDIETRDIDAVFARFQQDMKAAKKLPPLGEAGTMGAGYTYRAIGPLLSGDEVRRQRARQNRPVAHANDTPKP
jgi:molybdate transport system substrate-binding protein